MKPSAYQLKIYYFVEAGRGDGIVRAVAGSGKTTTIVAAANLVRSPAVLFLAFNREIVKELRSRLKPTIAARTLNALGHVTLQAHLNRRLEIEDYKYDRIVSAFLKQRYAWLRGEPRKETKRAILDLVSYAQSGLVDPPDVAGMQRLVTHFGIDLPTASAPMPAEIYALAGEAMAEGEELARDAGIVSFEDQIWLCARWELTPTPADFIFVDEAQDLGPAKMQLVLSARAPGGRILWVGDPRQAIYGFAGADSRSMDAIEAATGSRVLDLSVCYRCPSAHLELARKIVPSIETAPNAPAGTIASIGSKALAKIVRNGDLILCRKTAPLIQTCLELITAKVPARVKGRDLGRQLVEAAEAALGTLPWSDFGEALDIYRDRKLALLRKKEGGEKKISALLDTIASLHALHEAFDTVEDFDGFSRSVKGIFSDDAAVVELSTIHRAKGLESDRVFLIDYASMPMVWAGQQPWELEQEMNLKYVALTRSRSELYFVNTEESAPATAAAPAQAVLPETSVPIADLVSASAEPRELALL
jgi:superfamily I DNA/RNA helicase